MPFALLFILFLGLGTSVAAETALPGDVLYPVKVNVNEEVQGWLAVSDLSEVKLQAKLVERRLDEAEKLAIEGNLNADVQAQLESNFKAYSDRVSEKIAALQADGKAEVALEATSEFESSLRAHESILARFREEAEAEMRSSVEGILNHVRVNADAASRWREESEVELGNKAKGMTQTDAGLKAKAELEVAAEGKQKAAFNKIEEVRRFIEQNEAELSAEAEAQAEARLTAADHLMVEGKASLEAKAFAEAFVQFQRAHRKAQEAKALVKTLLDLFELEAEVESEVEGEAEIESESDVKADDREEKEERQARPGSSEENIQLEGEVELNGQAEVESNEEGSSGSSQVEGGARVELQF